ncbi:transcriptional antiterminator, BglG family [Terribacillus aidingensis]|uniref:Transcriptional antiterminator, BglG family n=1 Tax=Terribacillus aidingensis TaxID=586416 RepID=A0A285P606_9BACI|nr:PRD domain-containing protein [Terribacillus aidingensis]SNZ17164.1 transcriptional antiterminator, BglG family [Terribacillus aidingensis]
MKIEKILNNSVVVTKNKTNQELVVMGKGLAFKKKIGDTIEAAQIEKKFVLEKSATTEKLETLLRDISPIYLNIAAKIVEYARGHLPYELDEYLYAALTDHLSFAISREKQGIKLNNPLAWEIRKYYKQEYQIAWKALDVIEEDTGYRLGEDEAASIALHLVNSQLNGEHMLKAVQVTEIVSNLLNIVTYHLKGSLDENTVNYERFLTHLRFFAVRFLRNERLSDLEESFLYEQVRLKYKYAFECTEKMNIYLKGRFDSGLTQDEQLYLTVHIHRLIKQLH